VAKEKGNILEALDTRKREKPKYVKFRVEKNVLIMGQDVVIEQVMMYQATTLI